MLYLHTSSYTTSYTPSRARGLVQCAMAEPKPPTQQPVGWPKTIAMLILFHLTYLILPLTFIVVSGGRSAPGTHRTRHN